MHSKSTFYSILALSIKDSNKSSRLFDINHEQFNFLEYKNTANVRERNLLTIISKILYRHSKTYNEIRMDVVYCVVFDRKLVIIDMLLLIY